MAFDYNAVLRPDLPAPAERWGGFPAYNFIGGHNDSDNIPVDELVAATTAVLSREGATLANYGLLSGPQGYRPLRQFVAAALAARAGIACTADDVLITSGSLQALDLVNQLLLAPGDTAIVEAQTYGGALTRLQALGIAYVGVPVDADGMRMDALEATLARLRQAGTRPKYIYTIPTVQNPTGTVMTKERRLELLRLAAEFGVAVFEDDCYADLLWDGARPPAIHALDDTGGVIYCGSFSKSIAPALRVGYIVANWTVLSRILPLKTDAGSGALEQMVLAEYCPDHFDGHVAVLTETLRAKRDVMVEALAAEFGTTAAFVPPKGGIFVWITLPEAVDTSKLAAAALAEGVALNPGAEWSSDPADGRHRLRLCFGHPSKATIREGVAKLADICHRETGLPERSANVERS